MAEGKDGKTQRYNVANTRSALPGKARTKEIRAYTYWFSKHFLSPSPLSSYGSVKGELLRSAVPALLTTTCSPSSLALTVSTATKLAVFMARRRDGHISLKLSLCTSTTGTWTTSSSPDFVLWLTPSGDKKGDGY